MTDKTRIVSYVDDVTLAKLDMVANDLGMSKSAVMKVAFDYYFRKCWKWDKEKEKKLKNKV